MDKEKKIPDEMWGISQFYIKEFYKYIEPDVKYCSWGHSFCKH